jgi:hypothetical protein
MYHMNKFKKIITARRMSLGLILFLAGCLYLSTVIPQKIDSSAGEIEAWRQAHVGLIWLVDAVQLHKMYAQPWFAVIILCAALALGVSCFDQLKVARRKLYSFSSGAGEEAAGSVTVECLHSVARVHHYRAQQSSAADVIKYVRNPWGYFGNLILHTGMFLVITASLYVALTGRQGVIVLSEGQQLNSRQPLDVSEHGMLSAPLKLPGTIRLNKVRVRFSANGQPPEVFSDLSISDESGRNDSLTASINRIQRYHGLRIYHAAQFGDAFTVVFTDKSGVSHTEKIMVQQSANLATAGYSDDFDVSWSPYRYSAKYFADVERKSMESSRPEFVIRVMDGKKEIARTSLTPGSSELLGEYRVKLDGVEKWAKLIIVDIAGMPLIFAGFAIIMFGGLIHYMTPPRELIGFKLPDGSYQVYWKAPYFRDFFKDELDDIIRELNKESAV